MKPLDLEVEFLEKELNDARQTLEKYERTIEKLRASGLSAGAVSMLEKQAAEEAERVTSLERKLSALRASVTRAGAEEAIRDLAWDFEPGTFSGPGVVIALHLENLEEQRRGVEAEAETLRKRLVSREAVLRIIDGVSARALELQSFGVKRVIIETEDGQSAKAALSRSQSWKSKYDGDRPKRSERKPRRFTSYTITNAKPEYSDLIGAVVSRKPGADFRTWRELIEKRDPALFAELEDRRLRGSNWSGAMIAQRYFGVAYATEES